MVYIPQYTYIPKEHEYYIKQCTCILSEYHIKQCACILTEWMLQVNLIRSTKATSNNSL